MSITLQRKMTLCQKFFAWVNIGIQVCFPLIGTFSMPRVFAEPAPAVVSADAEEHTLAEWTSRAAGWLSDRHRADSSDMVRGVAAQQANQAITQWLSPYASVRAQLGMDRGF